MLERRDRWEDSRGKVEAESDNGLLRLRIRNVTRPVEPSKKVQIKGKDKSNKVIEATSGDVS